MVSRKVRERDMEVWNGKIDNINESFRKRDELDTSYVGYDLKQSMPI
jgi:hypothetical protein